MTLSTIYNPYSVIGANTIDANKVGESLAFGGNSGLFAQLLQTTGVQQVAYAGSDKEFDLTLEMKDETVAHEAKMGEDHQKYDGLGLFSADAAAIESTRAAKKPYETAPDQVGKKAQNGSENGAGSNGKDESAAAGLLVVSDADELIALGAPSKDTGVDATRAANATEAQRAANAQVLQPNNNGVKQNAGDAALSRAKPVISAEELPKSRYATSEPRPANGPANGNQPNVSVQVAKVQEEVVSQPTNTLAASAALAVQTAKAEKPAVEAPVTIADDLDSEVRTPLANNGGRPTSPQVPHQQSQPIVPSPTAGLAPAPQPAPQPAIPNAAAQQAQLATAVRADGGGQSSQPFADPIASGQANNSQQSAQRAQRAEAPQPPRPPVPPQEVTNQVAVQIKKAIGQGNDQIRIQLKPAELGRVDVRLEVTDSGRAVAIVSAERPETLDLLQRDAAGLRQALQDAGLSTDSNSLSFNLRGEGSKFEQELAERGHAPQRDDEASANNNGGDETDPAEAALIAAELAAADGRVNVQV